MDVGWNQRSRRSETTWVELLVPRAIVWNKHFGALGGLSY